METENTNQKGTMKLLAKAQAMEMPTVYLQYRVHRETINSVGVRKSTMLAIIF